MMMRVAVDLQLLRKELRALVRANQRTLVRQYAAKLHVATIKFPETFNRYECQKYSINWSTMNCAKRKELSVLR